MLYKCVTVSMNNSGEIVEGKRSLYFLRPGKLYRVVEIVNNN